jgi:hypothetical protein
MADPAERRSPEEKTVTAASSLHHSVTPNSLLDDYLADLEADLKFAQAQGDEEYAQTVRTELEALQRASSVRIDRYGVPRLL